MLLKSTTVCCLLLLLALVAISVEAKKNRTKGSHTNSTKWKGYKKKLNLTILQEVADIKSFENFEKKDELIEEHNSNPDKIAELGHNEFSHLSSNEIDSKLKGFKVPDMVVEKRAVGSAIRYSSFNGAVMNIPFNTYVPTSGYVAPASVDWRQRGFNTPVRNQNPCGDCWAFAAAGALEASLSITLKTNVTLSPQQLTDCAGGSWGNNGCNGGFSITAYNYIFSNGIPTEGYYPFKGTQATCSYAGTTDKTHGNLFTVSQMYMAQQGNDQALMELLDKYGPVTIGMDASSPLFSSYKSGIFASPNSPSYPMCNASNIDHAMLLVGYGVDNVTNEKYWLVKNTWGTTWGEQGYLRVSREVVNNCGISTWGVLPVAVLGSTNPTTASTTTTTTTTIPPPASSLICDGKIRADSGCLTGYSCVYNTMTSTCTGGMWSAASSTATCGQSYSTCKATAAFAGCKNEGIFLASGCSQRIQCTLSKTLYTAPAGSLLDDTVPAYKSGWTCPK